MKALIPTVTPVSPPAPPLPVVYFRWHRDVGSGSHFDFMTILSGYNTTPAPHPCLCCYGWPCRSTQCCQGSGQTMLHKTLPRYKLEKEAEDLSPHVSGSHRWIWSIVCGNIPSCWASYDKCEGGGWCWPVRKSVGIDINSRWITPDLDFQCKVRLIQF